jgi:amino acid transporter
MKAYLIWCVLCCFLFIATFMDVGTFIIWLALPIIVAACVVVFFILASILKVLMEDWSEER